MTVPLALLLPSGLLTYLGLQMVELMEHRYTDQINSIKNETLHKVRNKAREKLDALVQSRFLPLVEEKWELLIPSLEPQKDDRFQLDEEVEFIESIFIYLSNEKLFFYFPSPQDPAVWEMNPHGIAAFSDSLDGRIKSELNLDPVALNPSEYSYFVSNRDRLFQGNRKLAAYKIFRPDTEQNGGSLQKTPAHLVAIGFTFDFQYINEVFFDEIINHIWNNDELRYPVMIYDMVENRRVAQPVNIGMMELNVSQTLHPSQFSDLFPWYRLYYSSETGQDILDIARTDRFIYYCLIATANIIMIVAIIGSIRNINQELILSDMRSDFVARVSHELRTPLGLIRLYSETLEMGRTRDPEKQKEYLHAITKESERLTHLINNVLNFSQIEARRKQYKPVNTPIAEVVEESVDTIRYHLERKGFELKVHIAENLPPLMCDRDAMQLALYNLLSNAMKYSGEHLIIELDVRQEKNEVVLSVKDHGIGIAKEHQHKIFQEFYRVDDPVVRSTGGSGLGLAVTKHIVEGHQGRISVESQPGKGSLFRVYLPIQSNRNKVA